jgi:hypothetical protein
MLNTSLFRDLLEREDISQPVVVTLSILEDLVADIRKHRMLCRLQHLIVSSCGFPSNTNIPGLDKICGSLVKSVQSGGLDVDELERVDLLNTSMADGFGLIALQQV